MCASSNLCQVIKEGYGGQILWKLTENLEPSKSYKPFRHTLRDAGLSQKLRGKTAPTVLLKLKTVY